MILLQRKGEAAAKEIVHEKDWLAHMHPGSQERRTARPAARCALVCVALKSVK